MLLRPHRVSFQGDENALKLTVVMVAQPCENATATRLTFDTDELRGL